MHWFFLELLVHHSLIISSAIFHWTIYCSFASSKLSPMPFFFPDQSIWRQMWVFFGYDTLCIQAITSRNLPTPATIVNHENSLHKILVLGLLLWDPKINNKTEKLTTALEKLSSSKFVFYAYNFQMPFNLASAYLSFY